MFPLLAFNLDWPFSCGMFPRITVSNALLEIKLYADQWQLRLLSFYFHTFLFSVALRGAEESGVEPAWCFPEPLPGTCHTC